MPGARHFFLSAPKKQCGLYLDRQRPQKKTCACLAKVSLTTLPLSARPEMRLVLTTASLQNRITSTDCGPAPLKLLPFGGAPRDFSRSTQPFYHASHGQSIARSLHIVM